MNMRIKQNKILQNLNKIVNPVSAKADVKRSHVIQLFVGLALLILLNVVGNYVFFKADLTQEKRYSLSKSTKQFLKGTKTGVRKIGDAVTVRCYLDGDIPASYKELRNSLKDLLNEFRSYNSDIEYEFVDPNNFKTNKEKAEFYEKLFSKGFSPLLIKTMNKGKQEQQYIFPYIEISYAGRSSVKSLISTKTGFSDDEIIKSSIQNLEYTLYSSIRSLVQGMKPSIAFLYGQGEPDAAYFLDIIQSLNDEYSVDSITINGQINALVRRTYDSVDNTKIKFRKNYECLIVAQPVQPFTPKDLYIIDQYIMHGGKVLWLLDPLTANMDSLQSQSKTMAVSNLTGAEECLFAYGIKLNNDLVMDLQCVKVPIVTGQYGNGQPQMTYYPWNFFPSVSPNAKSIITDKINPVKLEFVSTIDNVESNSDVTVTPLLESSVNTRLLNAPVEVSLQMLKQKQEPKLFNQGSKTMAVLAEGKFASAFRNRLPLEMTENPVIANKNESDSTAMIVVADGDIIKNGFKNGQVVPLGWDIYTNQMFGNKEFLINCINYLCGDKDLIPLRSREVIVRKLDMAKAERTKLQWQLFNIITPMVIIALLGTVLIVIRKKSYTSR
ncbi:MAG: gliding motility-associated ABC transporter substrate-binding protein GldG [Bacteroidales bacterium]|nr:gliding motility-associated ABC transporter substrate-binding protein GldG [Bacteroidales bacterium]